MKNSGLQLVLGMTVLAFGLTAVPAYALSLAPGGQIAIGVGTGPCGSDCIEIAVNPVLNPDVTDLILQYKSDVSGSSGVGADSGPRAADYTTTFSNSASDPQDALIDYIGTTAIDCLTKVCILEVKDGDHTPGRYFFNITGWDGTDNIVLTSFWPGSGAISHVSIHNGGSAASVPEPASLFLFGAGLAGLGIWRRKQA